MLKMFGVYCTVLSVIGLKLSDWLAWSPGHALYGLRSETRSDVCILVAVEPSCFPLIAHGCPALFYRLTLTQSA